MFALPGEGMADVHVYDIAAEPVRSIPESALNESSGYGIWDGRDDQGSVVPAGMYILVVRQGGKQWVFRVTVLR